MHCILFYLAYVADIYNQLVTTHRKELQKVEKELKEENPGPLRSMLPENNPGKRWWIYFELAREKTILIAHQHVQVIFQLRVSWRYT